MTRNRYLRAFAVTGLAGALMTGCLSGGSSSGSSVPEPTPAPATPPDGAATPPPPDLGPNVTIFKSDTPLDEINSTLRALSAEEEFSENRRAVLFMPGVYGSDEGRADPSAKHQRRASWRALTTCGSRMSEFRVENVVKRQ